MDYILLIFASLCIAVQFNINKVYQKKYADGVKDMLFFPFACGLTGALFFLVIGFILYGKPPEISLFSLVASAALAVVSTLSSLVGLITVKYGKISVYSAFMMLGGMILPYFYGVFLLGESLSAARIAGIVILICALCFMTVNPSEKSTPVPRFYYILCAFIFCLNGTVSVISKTHSIGISAVPAANFIVYANLWQTIINGAGLIFFKRPSDPKIHTRADGFRRILIITSFSVVSGAGFLFQLISAQTVPAVVIYPFITGASIVLSAVLARIFFGEKINKPALAGICMAVTGAMLFLIA